MEIKKNKSKPGSKIKIQDDGSYAEVLEVSFLCTKLSRFFQEASIFNFRNCYFQGGPLTKLTKVEITLADCLACSGCITSAESVLVTQQSQEELLRVFKEKIEKQKV